MIKEITDLNDKSLINFCKKHIFAARVYSNILAYLNFFSVFEAYVQITDGKITAVMSSLDQNIVLYADENADFEELEIFIHMQNKKSLFCTSENARSCNQSVKLEGSIMMHKDQSKLRINHEVCLPPEYKDVYGILEKNSGSWINLPCYEDWYADMNHKVRHGICTMAAVYSQKTAVSCGIIVANSTNDAVVGGIGTLSDYRGKGYAGSVVSTLVSYVIKMEKQPYLFRDKGKNQAFYENLGFLDVDFWVVC